MININNKDFNYYLEDLYNLLRIPSVSSNSDHADDMIRIAEAYQRLLTKYGFENNRKIETKGHPAVFASKQVDKNLPTVLIYGHMDVMPADPIDKWQSQPFDPKIIDNKLFCRGADDNKGQTFLSLVALHQIYLHLGEFPCNIKILLEGEEEIGSPNLPLIIEKYKQELKADFILVSDTSMISEDCPSITAGLRGLAYWEIELTGPNRDLHSGIFGGAIQNPINALCRLLNQVKDNNGKITIPGFYDNVRELTPQEKELLNSALPDEQFYKQRLGIKEIYGEKGYSTLERTGTRPTFDICGIWGGHTSEGTKTVIPSKAYAKISSRLVANLSLIHI